MNGEWKMENRELINLLIKHEELKLKPYICPAGHLTIGVGRNLDDLGISKDEAMYLLKNDIKRVEQELREIFPEFDELPENVRMVLIDMDFNLGKTRFLTFKNMIQAVKNRDWERMIREMKDSRWCEQVKSRCDDDVKLINMI